MDKEQIQKLGKVAVLMGGISNEREISLMSGEGVLQALKAAGVNAHAIDIKDNFDAIWQLARQGFTRCFITLHGRYGEDGTVQGALELLKIPYTGAGVMASAISIDKLMTKKIWAYQELPTPAYQLIKKDQITKTNQEKLIQKLGLPLIVKPAREGSSIGLTIVKQAEQLTKALEKAAQLDADILCETYISGQEVTCPIIGEGESAKALPIIQILAPDGNYDYEHKYFAEDVQYLVPCPLPQEQQKQIQELCLDAYKAVNCRGWGRIDVMIDKQTNKPYLLEINTSPGMTGHSLVPMSAKAAGIDYKDLCIQILAEAKLDYTNEKNHASQSY